MVNGEMILLPSSAVSDKLERKVLFFQFGIRMVRVFFSLVGKFLRSVNGLGLEKV